ncbi:MAG: carboxypeptidase regulatory-like domain-containing protein [Pirellulales bacterium]|nr:carboxypeptidase regulatory-like domain-containing protein [Pirellulales bacterium]
MSRLCQRLTLCTVFFLLSVCGCSKYKTYDVTGTVKFTDGSPVAGVCLTFETDTPPISATCITDSEGKFTLSTLGDGDGAPVGHYRVLIAPPQMADPDSPPPVRFHPKYRSFKTSGLEFDVDAKSNHFDIKLDPPGR